MTSAAVTQHDSSHVAAGLLGRRSSVRGGRGAPTRTPWRARARRRGAGRAERGRRRSGAALPAQLSASWSSSEQAADAVADHGGQPADRGRDHRGGAGLGLDGDQAERLVVGRYGDQRSPRRTTWPARAGRPAARTAPRRRCRGARPGRPARSGCSRPEPDGPPTTGTTTRERSSGARSSSTATARSRTSGAFSGWIRPANISTSGLGRQPELAAYGGPVQRAEGGQVDAGVDHLDPSGVGVVEVDQLLGLDVGVGDQHVGGLDHLVLADDPGRPARGRRRRRARRS